MLTTLIATVLIATPGDIDVLHKTLEAAGSYTFVVKTDSGGGGGGGEGQGPGGFGGGGGRSRGGFGGMTPSGPVTGQFTKNAPLHLSGNGQEIFKQGERVVTKTADGCNVKIRVHRKQENGQ